MAWFSCYSHKYNSSCRCVSSCLLGLGASRTYNMCKFIPGIAHQGWYQFGRLELQHLRDLFQDSNGLAWNVVHQYRCMLIEQLGFGLQDGSMIRVE
jgi:hypothetical protein